MAAAILAGAGMYVVVVLATGVVLPWRELVAGESVWATGAAVRASLGTVGVAILSVAVVLAILTGINGFFMASSRLIFSMGRARLLPAWFGRIDRARGTPRNALLFTGAVSLLAPWFGREVIVWVVDMAAVGTACGYLYTCLAAFSLARRRRARMEAALGAILSAGFLVLLCVPGMPGFMALPSWIGPGRLDRARRAVLLPPRPGVRGDSRRRAGHPDPRSLPGAAGSGAPFAVVLSADRRWRRSVGRVDRLVDQRPELGVVVHVPGGDQLRQSPPLVSRSRAMPVWRPALRCRARFTRIGDGSFAAFGRDAGQFSRWGPE